jgi:hypothetical protein
MNLPEKFNYSYRTSREPSAKQRTGHRSPRRSARFLGAMLMLASGSFLGAPPAYADDGHATYVNGDLPYHKWARYQCEIYAGIGVDDWHLRPNYHFMGGGQVVCRDGRARDISFTVRQFVDADNDHSSGVSEVGDAGAFTGRTSNAFAHTGPVCRTSNVYVWFQTRVKVNISGNTTAWLPGPWIRAGDGCVL